MTETRAEYQATRCYWMKTDIEGYREHVFSRKEYFENEFPNLNAASFKSHLLVKYGVKIGSLTKDQIKEYANNWVPKKPRGMQVSQ